jgi:hypothetical protein
MAEDLNIVVPEGDRRTGAPGDVPERLRGRYLTERRAGRWLDFYADARARTPVFRDHGGRLSTHRNDPHVVRDLVAIAEHRGWRTISIGGHMEFRRQVWLRARATGLEVSGYRPTARDRQQAERRGDPAPGTASLTRDAGARLNVVERVVRARVLDPAAQDRILATARERLAHWLQRGASFERRATERGRVRD